MSLIADYTVTTPTGRPRKLPRKLAAQRGLSEGTILRLRKHAEKMSRQPNKGSFAAIFTAKILAALSESGLARLSMPEILSLARTADDMPGELANAVAIFIAAHPPVIANYAGLKEAIRAGALGGTAGLIRLHRHVEDRLRKARAKAAKRTPRTASNPSRPRLAPLADRAKTAEAVKAKAVEAEIQATNAALAKLYRRRYEARLKPHLDFIEVAQALRDAGYPLVERHRQAILEIAKEMSA